jgi:Mn-dependent DtxR family transcriptional regulator
MVQALSPSSEDYLEAIYDLSSESAAVRSVDVSTRLGVSRASVNKAVGLLKEAGFVEQEPYGSLMLTKQGLVRAASVRRRHNVICSFLRDILSISPDVAEEEACRIEHIISDVTLEHLADFVEANIKK